MTPPFTRTHNDYPLEIVIAGPGNGDLSMNPRDLYNTMTSSEELESTSSKSHQAGSSADLSPFPTSDCPHSIRRQCR